MVPKAKTTSQFARWLRTRYILAIFLLSFLIVVAQFILQTLHFGLDNSAYLVNIAGRQRMLSERLVKLAFILTEESPAKEKPLREEFNKGLSLWERSHRALLIRPSDGKLSGTNNEEISELFRLLDPKFRTLAQHFRCFNLRDRCRESSSALLVHMDEAQRSYFHLMNKIVFAYSEESRKDTRRVSQIQLLLCITALALLLAASIFLFRPTLSTIERHFEELESSLRRAEIAEFQSAELQRIKLGLVSHLSHEIWNPLNSIIEISRRPRGIEHAGDNNRISTYLDLIEQNANRLLFLLNEILNISETRLEISQPLFSTFDITQELREVLSRLEQLAQAKEVTLDLILIDEKCAVLADRDRLRQLLISIIYNAIRYASSPSRLRIIFERRNASDLLLILRDHNLSAELTVLERMFREVHLDTSTEINFLSEQSLSLTVARQFVKLH